MSSYYNENFEPFAKKNWYATLNMSLKGEDLTNEPHFSKDVLDGKSTIYKIVVGTGYYFSDNFAAGLGFSFGENRFTGDVIDRNDTIYSNSLTYDYSLSPLLRSSIPVVPNKRLSLYVDLGFSFGWGNTASRDEYYSGMISKSYADNFSFGAGVAAGVTFFIMESFAVELGLPIVGYYYTMSKNTVDEEAEAIDRSHEVAFELDLLGINLGLTYYIGTKN